MIQKERDEMNDCSENCPVLPRVEQLERDNEQHRATHREMFDRLRELEREGAVQAATLTAMDEKLDKLVEWQEEQREKPGNLVDKLKENVIWMLCAAVIGFVLAKFGL